jgi:hypothetical protein
MADSREAQLKRRQQALSTRQKLGLITILAKQGQGFV